MKRTRFVAYGGILTAVSVVLLLLASICPGASWALCISAGTIPAIPLVHRQVRLGIHIYFATSLLAALMVPGKRFVVAYIVLFGVYPLIKYGIERIHRLPAEWACKLLYAALVAALVPGKRFVVAYIVLFGVYPLIKYGIERIHRLPAEWACKLLYAALVAAFLLFLLRLGVLPLGEHAAALPHALLTAAFFIAFACYDILFSKIIALFRMLFRDRP